MARIFEDWIEAFQEYSSFGEAPRHVYFWVGVSVIAGALQRKVYIDQYYFRWYPNHFIILVAPPGEISKTTTASIGMKLLKQVPSVHFGPNVVTWQALVKHLGMCVEDVETEPGIFTPMAAMTISSSELGNLINPQDKEMIDMLVTLWDGEDIRKMTKSSGSDEVPNPLLNLIACTTPSWITSSIPEYMLGGGFMSRCLFVHANAKARYVAYPGLNVPQDIKHKADALVQDLQRIASLRGEFGMTREAITWGQEWYEKLAAKRKNADNRLKDFLARKQTHIHKLAMILSASRRDSLEITAKDLQDADDYISQLEPQMLNVLSAVGRSSDATVSDRIVEILASGPKPTADVYRQLITLVPKSQDFQSLVAGLVEAGIISLLQVEGKPHLGLKKTPV